MTHENRITPRGDERRESFRVFNERGGKFRVAVVNRCNLDCFFCHNEGMANPRRPRDDDVARSRAALDADALVALMNAWCRLGGRQVNVTGGEPLARPDLPGILERVDKRGARIVVNTNGLLAPRLLGRPRIEAIDSFLISLHTTDERAFSEQLGAPPGSAAKVMANAVALSEHGYTVELNYSLGDYNKHEIGEVLDFALDNGLDLKTIALVRSDGDEQFYGGDWIDPAWVARLLVGRGARRVKSSAGLGGRSTTWKAGRSTVRVKNVADGRLETTFCGGCRARPLCGEGIYALRVGVDGIFKPCLLGKDRWRNVEDDRDASPEGSERDAAYDEQILDTIHAMIGDWSRASFRTGAPA